MTKSAVDGRYRLLPSTRAFLAARRRAHGFDLLARPPSRTIDGTWTAERWLPEGPVRVAAGECVAIAGAPEGPGGLCAAVPEASAPARAFVMGEPLPPTPVAGRHPLTGPLTLRWGPRAGVLRGVRFMQASPGPFDTVDRLPVHLPVRVDEVLTVPLPPWRSGLPVAQLAVHWGSVAYRAPETQLPLGAWGYPYYLDGVLGDVHGLRRGRWRPLARGKFLEFDEVEGIHGFTPGPLDAVLVRLYAREAGVTPPVCRIGAVEVRYRDEARPLFTLPVRRWVKPGLPFDAPLPAVVRLGRVEVTWRDEGPAMGALGLGRGRSGWVNVCSGDTFPFPWLGGAVSRSVRLHARFAPFFVERLDVYGAPA